MIAVDPQAVGRESGEAVVVELQAHRKRNLSVKVCQPSGQRGKPVLC